jgi:Raf kinase inhibitor-like YbhB/YbcL family protein
MGIQTIEITSPAFGEGQPIPAKYTCDGHNVSPPVQWTGVPPEAKSLVFIGDDPDAPGGTWVHWVLYGLAATVSTLPEDLPKSQYVLQGARQGLNDFGHLGYGGPCPPRGKPHRYFFKLYALDADLEFLPGATKEKVVRALPPHLLAEGSLMGTYQRQ